MLGRPGCGKSAVYRELEKLLVKEGLAKTFERLDDFPKLWNKFMIDNELEANGKPRKYSQRLKENEYKVVNNAMWDDILKDLNDDILSKPEKKEHLIFIEFSRPNNVESLKNFSEKVINNALIVYIDVAFEICWQRNVKRHEQALANKQDDHLVPREEMEATYLNDDRDLLKKYTGCPVVIINNEKEGEEHLKKQVEIVLNSLKTK